MKKVSVIVPIYKGNRYIPNLIHMLEKNWESANKVEDVDIEVILVNDFPSEQLAVKEEWFKNISSVQITNKQNCGIHFSRVQGFQQSKGDYILFLDQDDQISPVYLREQLKIIENNEMTICNGKNYNDLIYKNITELNSAVDENEYRKGNNKIVSPGQVLLRKQAIPVEWLNNILKHNGADDYFLWMLMFCKKHRIGIHEKALYLHVISDENTSKDISEMDRSVIEMAEKMKSLGFLTPDEETKLRESRIRTKGEGIREEEITFEKFQKEQNYKRILEKWMVLRDRRISVEKYFLNKHLKNIIIYGGGILGKHLYYELQESNIKVKCFMDKYSKAEIRGVETVAPGAYIGTVDAIIVTPIMEYIQIREQLKGLYSCEIISIESVLLNADCELLVE